MHLQKLYKSELEKGKQQPTSSLSHWFKNFNHLVKASRHNKLCCMYGFLKLSQIFSGSHVWGLGGFLQKPRLVFMMDFVCFRSLFRWRTQSPFNFSHPAYSKTVASPIWYSVKSILSSICSVFALMLIENHSRIFLLQLSAVEKVSLLSDFPPFIFQDILSDCDRGSSRCYFAWILHCILSWYYRERYLLMNLCRLHWALRITFVKIFPHSHAGFVLLFFSTDVQIYSQTLLVFRVFS